LQYTNRLTKAKKPIVNPTPISYEDYHKMLNYAIDKKDLTYKAILLIALNCGMRQSDLADIRIKKSGKRQKPDIDLDNKTLQMPRPKTGIIRVAILWDRTVDAINEMLQERKKQKIDSEYLFLNSYNRPIREQNIRRWWERNRKHAKLDKSVKFEHIRDATQTIPLDDDPKSLVETNLIMGHSVTGMANNYLERRPVMVRRACAAIEAYFFPIRKILKSLKKGCPQSRQPFSVPKNELHLQLLNYPKFCS
jgi:integrase